MGSLLKEVLRHICGESGGWSYAVFWKISHPSPTFLVWEEGHHDSARHTGVPDILEIGITELVLNEWEALRNSSADPFGQLKGRTKDSISNLVNNIMMHQVHVIGEGIIGRTAFAGTHQWILRESELGGWLAMEDDEVKHQFLAGIQTIAVIPVLPHGVIQLGSTHTITESTVFVHGVKSLFAQLGSLTGSLSSDGINKAVGQETQLPTSLGIPVSADQAIKKPAFTPFSVINSHRQIPNSELVNQLSCSVSTSIQGKNKAKASPRPMTSSPIIRSIDKPNCNFSNNLLQIRPENEFVRAQVILSNPEVLFNQPLPAYSTCCSNNTPTSSYTRAPLLGNKIPYSIKDPDIVSLLGRSEAPNTESDLATQKPFPSGMWGSLDKSGVSTEGNGLKIPGQPDLQVLPVSKDPNDSVSNQKIDNDLFEAFAIPLTGTNHCDSLAGSMPGVHDCWVSRSQTSSSGLQRSRECFCKASASFNMSNKSSQDAPMDPCVDSDLYDALGVDFKGDRFCGSMDDNVFSMACRKDDMSIDISACITQLDGGHGGSICADAVKDEVCEILSESGSDHLLDAVVWKINSNTKQNSKDSASCNTKLTKINSSSASSSSQVAHPVQIQRGELFGLPPTIIKPVIMKSGSFKSNYSMGNTGDCSQTDGTYKSEISLWVQGGQNLKGGNVSTEHSKRLQETVNLNQKRPRIGERSRPRPKDRQLFQDRLKDLREIIPSGAKYSIDVLLERTIKHILFLQSVTKHADKLKVAGESKFITKEGGLLLKDNFEGGATWAFEVGSQSMVCPIIVKDLNGPRQMLIEMLCEECGFFLEIADIIKGLGLTILKGLMESQNDTIWARFVVEANKDVSRMEIFMALIHLLEQTAKNNTTLKGITHYQNRPNILEQSLPVTELADTLK